LQIHRFLKYVFKRTFKLNFLLLSDKFKILKIMKKFVWVLSLLCMSFMYINAQEYLPSREDLDRFYKTKTLVVLDDNPMLSYNFIIKDVMAQEWKLTPYDFISAAEFEAKRLDPQYSFIITTTVSFERDNTKANYKFLNLLLGGNYIRVNEMPDIVAVPLSYHGVYEDSYTYKLGSLLRFMQNHIDLITANPDKVTTNVFKYFRDNIDSISSKTLYIVKDELAPDVNVEAKIKKIYPYKFKIVTREEVEEAIEQRNPDVVYLHKVGPEGTKLIARCYKMILGAAEPKLYYFDYHRIDEKRPDGFLESDFKNLEKGKTFIAMP